MVPAPAEQPQSAAPPPDRDGLNCTKAEAAKIERFLGISPDAGMSDAIKLADSDNPDDRDFAAFIFTDMATPEAISRVQSLSHDSRMGSSAKVLLKYAKRGQVIHQVDQEFIPENNVTASH
jgi:hypothetical protein